MSLHPDTGHGTPLEDDGAASSAGKCTPQIECPHDSVTGAVNTLSSVLKFVESMHRAH